MHKFSIETHEDIEIAVLRVDGYMFTLNDWQSQQPREIGEADQYGWVSVDPSDPADTSQWRQTIMINGLPRVLE